MGLKLRYNLFYDVTAKNVFSIYSRFYSKRSAKLIPCNDEFKKYVLYDSDRTWVLLNWNGGWEWNVRREAQLFVSKELNCFGFLVFVYDGDYWGYEFFNQGHVLDRFVQDKDEGRWAFPDEPCAGNPQLLLSYLSWLRPDDISPYLVQYPASSLPEIEYRAKMDELRVLRPGDEYTRYSEVAVLNFLRVLNIKVTVIDNYIRPEAAIWREFCIKYPA